MVIVVGAQGSGKTLIVKELAFDPEFTHGRCFVIDERDEYRLGPSFRDFDALCDYVEKRERFVVVWKGGLGWTDRIFDLALALGRCCVVVEEASFADFDKLAFYRYAVLQGRKPARVSVIALVQHPHMMEKDYRAQITDVISFRCSEESSQRWLAAYFGKRADELETMPPLRGLHWEWGKPEIEQVYVGDCFRSDNE